MAKKFEKRDLTDRQRYWWIRSVSAIGHVNGNVYNPEADIEQYGLDDKTFSMGVCCCV